MHFVPLLAYTVVCLFSVACGPSEEEKARRAERRAREASKSDEAEAKLAESRDALEQTTGRIAARTKKIHASYVDSPKKLPACSSKFVANAVTPPVLSWSLLHDSNKGLESLYGRSTSPYESRLWFEIFAKKPAVKVKSEIESTLAAAKVIEDAPTLF